MVSDVYKCQNFLTNQPNEELGKILLSYFKFALKNWDNLQEGRLDLIQDKPEFTFKAYKPENEILENIPQLTDDEINVIHEFEEEEVRILKGTALNQKLEEKKGKFISQNCINHNI